MTSTEEAGKSEPPTPRSRRPPYVMGTYAKAAMRFARSVFFFSLSHSGGPGLGDRGTACSRISVGPAEPCPAPACPSTNLRGSHLAELWGLTMKSRPSVTPVTYDFCPLSSS